MAKRVQLIRHDTAGLSTFTGRLGELTVNISNNSVVVHNGATAGGFEMARADLTNVSGATTANAGKMTTAHVTRLDNAEIDILNLQTTVADILAGTGGVDIVYTTAIQSISNKTFDYLFAESADTTSGLHTQSDVAGTITGWFFDIQSGTTPVYRAGIMAERTAGGTINLHLVANDVGITDSTDAAISISPTKIVSINNPTFHAWDTTLTKSLQIGLYSNVYEYDDTVNGYTYTYLSSNSYHAAAGDTYIRTGEAVAYFQDISAGEGGFLGHMFLTAISGTAGAPITWHAALGVKADGLYLDVSAEVGYIFRRFMSGDYYTDQVSFGGLDASVSLGFWSNGARQGYLGTDGNWYLTTHAVPAWDVGIKVIQLSTENSIASGDTSSWMQMAQNAAYDPTGFYKYVADGPASRIVLDTGVMYFQVATSGLAGNNISFINAVELLTTGQLYCAFNTLYENTKGISIKDSLNNPTEVLTLDAFNNLLIGSGTTIINEIQLLNSGTTHTLIGATGNFAFGATALRAWDATLTVLQIGAAGAIASPTSTIEDSYFVRNAYWNGTNWIRDYANYCVLYTQAYTGEHIFYVGDNGSAGGIVTWTPALTINTDGSTTIADLKSRSSVMASDADSIGVPGISQVGFNLGINVTESTWESVGPTGSGATNIWTALDHVPADADWISMRVVDASSEGTTGSPTFYATHVYARKNGSTFPAAAGEISQVYGCVAIDDGIHLAQASGSSSFEVGLVAGLFDIFWESGFTAPNIKLFLTGYGYN